MNAFLNVLLAIAIVAVIFFLFDLFTRFLVNKVVHKKLPKRLVKLDDTKLQKGYVSTKKFAGRTGYIVNFFFTGLLVFSYMRIPKAQYKCYEAEMIKRGLAL
ncbi:hypothetical protein [Chryseobacterium sp. CT-SW4]|uniref:hypothetical protein n=1 Tax=Chryseobacterium sp. SW-1 TaxID=3157343 RepID=UPI003B01F743